jgi:glucose/arabinose dehydrogenase
VIPTLRTAARAWPGIVGLATALTLLAASAALPLPEIHPASVAVDLQMISDDLSLPVSVVALDDGSGRLALSQLEGLVVIVDDAGVRSEPLLDLRARVTGREGEQGLYSVAIESSARASARGGPRMVVAAFTERDTGDIVVAGYPLDDTRWVADAGAETPLLRVPVPEPYHHGGQVAFGPDDMLWVSIGDGESANHFLRVQPPTAQDLRSLRGKLLRIDPFPSASADAAAYRVPSDNPLIGALAHDGTPAAPEIWAYGFRNPWRFTFHPETGDVLLADVGNDRWEEINRVRAGGNHGWPSREGPECQAFPDAPGLVDPTCPERSFVEPLVALAHLALDPRGAQAVTGGTVVRDPALPELDGRFLFGDFVTGRIWSLDLDDGRLELLLETSMPLTSIATGHAGEVLVLSLDGVLARLVAREP